MRMLGQIPSESPRGCFTPGMTVRAGELRVAGLFAGIGGIELGLRRAGHATQLLCEVWEPARAVLTARFPEVALEGDVRELRGLPEVELLTAGFPCTDLSQAGRTAGIDGKHSGLVREVFRLLRTARPEWLLLENVRNMLPLDRGRAMRYLVCELEEAGYTWAYRVVDSRFTGVPQRRHRVLLLASHTGDPRQVLLSEDAGEPDESNLPDDAFGFYWTEGLRGIGWARDATPPLKGGSGLGIPSPPGVWMPREAVGRRLVTPAIHHAEQLQGFDADWTRVDERHERARWKMVGNAVTVGVAEWVGRRLLEPMPYSGSADRELPPGGRWPNAAWGAKGRAWASSVSAWPRRHPYTHLAAVVPPSEVAPLSHRAAAGFLERAGRSGLRFSEDFLLDVKEHVAATRP